MRRLTWYATGLLAGALGLACGGCGGGSASAVPVRLAAGPPTAVFDTPVHITVHGVAPGLVTVQAEADDSQGRPWRSVARFRVGSAGTLNLASSPSSDINGAYGGKPGPAWTFHGQPLPAGTLIPVGRIRVPVLLADGGQDAVWDSVGSARAVVAELKAAHDRAPYLNLFYPRAGHGFLGYPPYFPYPWYSPNGPLGGSAQANSLAAEQSWARMISFLNHPGHETTTGGG